MIVGDELVRVHRHALGGRDRAGLADDAVEQPLAERIRLDLADLQTQDRAHGVDGGVHADLFPDELVDVVVGARLAVAPVSVAAAFTVALEHLGAGRVVELRADRTAEVHLHAAGRGGHAVRGLGQSRAQHAGADDAALFREDLEEVVIVAEAVDEGDGDGRVADDGHGVLDGLLELGRLGHVDDNVDLALRRGRVSSGGVGAEALELVVVILVAALFFLMDGEVHAFLGDLLHVGLIAVDEDDVRTALTQVRSEDAAGCAGTIHCKFHNFFSPFLNLFAISSAAAGACLTADYRTVLVRVPMPSMLHATSSPGCSHFGGSKPMPTPAGVPMEMIVPGRSVMPWLSSAITYGT